MCLAVPYFACVVLLLTSIALLFVIPTLVYCGLRGEESGFARFVWEGHAFGYLPVIDGALFMLCIALAVVGLGKLPDRPFGVTWMG